MDNRARTDNNGVLLAAGLIAGEALNNNCRLHSLQSWNQYIQLFSNILRSLISLLVFVVVAIVLLIVPLRVMP